MASYRSLAYSNGNEIQSPSRRQLSIPLSADRNDSPTLRILLLVIVASVYRVHEFFDLPACFFAEYVLVVHGRAPTSLTASTQMKKINSWLRPSTKNSVIARLWRQMIWDRIDQSGRVFYLWLVT